MFELNCINVKKTCDMEALVSQWLNKKETFLVHKETYCSLKLQIYFSFSRPGAITRRTGDVYLQPALNTFALILPN